MIERMKVTLLFMVFHSVLSSATGIWCEHIYLNRKVYLAAKRPAVKTEVGDKKFA